MKAAARFLLMAALLPAAAHAQGVRDGNGNVIIRDDVAASRGMDPRKPFFTYSVDGNGNYVGPGGGGTGGSPAAPTYTTPAGVTDTTTVCTLPMYSAGGNVVCTSEMGQQTTTACAANAGCLIAGPLATRKYFKWTNRTAGSTIDIGYAATVAPGRGFGYDGPTSGANGQGGSGSDPIPHVGAYYAATATAGAVLVFVQGQ